MIDISDKAPKVIDLRGEVITYVNNQPVKMHPKRDYVLDLISCLQKFEKDNQWPRKKSVSSLCTRTLEYVKAHNAIQKSELRGLLNGLNYVWEKVR